MFNLIEIKQDDATRKIINSHTIISIAPAPGKNGSIINHVSSSPNFSVEDFVAEAYETFKTIPGFFEVSLKKGGSIMINKHNIANINSKKDNTTVINMLSPNVHSTEEIEVSNSYFELKQKIGLSS